MYNHKNARKQAMNNSHSRSAVYTDDRIHTDLCPSTLVRRPYLKVCLCAFQPGCVMIRCIGLKATDNKDSPNHLAKASSVV